MVLWTQKEVGQIPGNILSTMLGKPRRAKEIVTVQSVLDDFEIIATKIEKAYATMQPTVAIC
ncbi:protein of unknown function [Candidatus Methylomirabilis oxygeniifera]|uniref:Uncharacterized protein n=1 Tax=Methylomirabilis oxygeniifera TaxID=671143 RepID=D5MN44_METO1|nr:protein of unknown function [Candidatus Methylomirabilis oxyfera]